MRLLNIGQKPAANLARELGDRCNQLYKQRSTSGRRFGFIWP